LGARRIQVIPIAGAAVSIAVLLVSVLSGGSFFGLIGKSEAASHNLEVQNMFKNRHLDGDAKLNQDLQIDESVVDTEHSCEFCTYITYTPGPSGFADVTYTDIVPHDLSGSKKMTLMIMGIKGGEQVSFEAAGKHAAGSNDVHFAVKTSTVTLSKAWKKIEIDLTGVDLSGITDPVKIHLVKPTQKGSVSFYIKHILFDTNNAVNPIPAVKQSS
jgi:hypothetical protein